MSETPDHLERDDTIDDLDVPAEQAEDVAGGGEVATYSIVNAWPSKVSGVQDAAKRLK